MTTRIETLDGGAIDAGFWGPDVSKIQLGELPMMSTQQFVGYAVLSLVEGVIPRLDAQTHAEWGRDARKLNSRVQKLATFAATGRMRTADMGMLIDTLQTGTPEDQAEANEALSAVATPTDEAEFYRTNPFVAQGDGRAVGFRYADEVKHVVGAEDFFNLTHNIIDGGLMGWGKHGTYPEVKEAAAKLVEGFGPEPPQAATEPTPELAT